MRDALKDPAPSPVGSPRIELICPGCRHVHEHPAEDRGRTTTCPECGQEFQATENVPIIYIPWEDRKRLGWFRGLWETAWTSLIAPQTFFRRMPIAGGWLSPLTYVAIVGGLALAVRAVMASVFPGTGPAPELAPEQIAAVRRVQMLLPLLAPAGALLFTVTFASVVHLMVLLLKGVEPRLQTTARVICYASAAQLLVVLPVVGVVLGGLWLIVLTVVGLREVQELSTGKAILAATAPLLLLLMLLMGPRRPPAQG